MFDFSLKKLKLKLQSLNSSQLNKNFTMHCLFYSTRIYQIQTKRNVVPEVYYTTTYKITKINMITKLSISLDQLSLLHN